MTSGLTGTWPLLRSYLRRDRWSILAWSIGGALLYWSQGVGVIALYATQEELDTAAASLEGNAAFLAMAGPTRALDTVGGEIFWQSSAFGAVVAGLMAMFLIGRHTRVEEETGRDELIRSTAIGRHAPQAAALSLGVIATTVLGVLTTASLFTIRDTGPLEGLPLPAADNIAAGAGLTAVGWVFCATALVAAQLTRSARGMYGVAGAVLGLAYLLRAVGDVGDSFWTWLSPIGWYQAMHVYSGLRWWPAALLVAAALVGALVASALFRRRDVGSGLLADRAGPAHAGPGLRSAAGLAWRLQRGAVIGWTGAIAFTGLAFGAMGDGVDDLFGDSDFAAQALAGGAGDLVDGFFATSAIIVALIGAGFTVSSAVRPRAEETDGHLEVLLAAGLDRSRWLLGHIGVTVVGTLLVAAAGGVGLGLGYLMVTGDGDGAVRYSAPALMQAAPMLVLATLARLLHGAWPSGLSLVWGYLGFTAVVLLFGESLQFPEWLQDLSVFHHLALVPAEDVSWAPLLALAAIAAVGSAAGQMAFRRRDVG